MAKNVDFRVVCAESSRLLVPYSHIMEEHADLLARLCSICAVTEAAYYIRH